MSSRVGSLPVSRSSPDLPRLLADEAEREGVVLLHENEKDIYGDTPERVLDLVDASCAELVDGPHDLPMHQRTLRSTITA